MAKRITTLEDINKEAAIAQELGDKAREGRAYNIFGSIYLKQGGLSESHSVSQQRFVYYQRNGGKSCR